MARYDWTVAGTEYLLQVVKEKNMATVHTNKQTKVNVNLEIAIVEI